MQIRNFRIKIQCLYPSWPLPRNKLKKFVCKPAKYNEKRAKSQKVRCY